MSSSSSLAPNKIHSLPVRVSYYLPSTSQTFTTLFATPQQVYVHPNTAAASTQNGQEEAWGSIYLKTVVSGVLMASPELHPAYPHTPDLSLYVLDPRETYLRRSRAGSSSFNHEVWTGKGLVSWALDEPGQGKNLITGRLIRSVDFATLTKQQEMNPLEALMMANMAGTSTHEEWGIEISVGLKSGISGFTSSSHPQVSSVMSIDGRPDAMRRSSTSSSTETHVSVNGSHFQRPQHPLPKRHEQPRRPQLPTSVHAHQPLGPSRVISASRSTPSRSGDLKHPKSSGSVSGSAGKKPRRGKSSTTSANTSRNSLGTIDPNSDPLKRRHQPMSQSSSQIKQSPAPSSDAAEPFPTDIPAGLFAKPESLTREQAQRLLASPAFLSMLEKLTGTPIDAAAAAKRAREDEDHSSAESSNKKPRLSHGHSRKGSTDSSGEPSHNAFVCWNCGRTKSAVWRTKVMEDGKSVRVCNACGLYWNKMGSMRPPTLWGDVDDDPKDRPRKDKKGPASSATRQSSQAPTSDPDIPALRIDKPATRSNNEHGFKRTLSSVVEEDAKRIAAHAQLRKSLPKSNLHHTHTTKPLPMSSPPRGSTSATKSLRNPKWNDQIAASSPIRWDNQNKNQVNKSDNFHTDPTESPATTLRKAYAQSATNTQTLDMPLSDDGPGPSEHKPLENNQNQNQNHQQINWGTDLSAFFDVEGFSMPPQPQPTHGHEIQRSISDQGKQMRKQVLQPSSSTGTEEDDVLSQLFNRTSSVGLSASASSPFDFSALPPSSPPISSSDSLPHSALLLSSPDNSPLNDCSPMESKHSTTPGKSRLRHSVSAHQIQSQHQPMGESVGGLDFEDIQRMLNNIGNGNGNNNNSPHEQQNDGQGNGYDMLHEIFGKLHDTQQHQQQGTSSSVGQTDEIIGGFHAHGHTNGEDIFAMLEGNAFAST
ncbi:uncharacterized protein L199_005494 [Kwoniella botswanensis]|uniref:uncharacterized protein n=1 Tax=Kwoniella botswanensis TaxID=1268659 RepID=UPI00315D49B5